MHAATLFINSSLCRTCLSMGDTCVADYVRLYARLDTLREAQAQKTIDQSILRPALSNFLRRNRKIDLRASGFRHIERCREALNAIDRRGWDRSFHQRQFHDHFLRACARVFWKTEPQGEFTRCHQKILDQNGWSHLSQEILVSTPRRFGKTISVSMFAAAMIFSAPAVEVSIYSTCKRISQKLLRNIGKFLEMIYAELKLEPYKIIRMNMEEIALQGPEGPTDVRVVNSYPSKVPPSPASSTAPSHFAHFLLRWCPLFIFSRFSTCFCLPLSSVPTFHLC